MAGIGPCIYILAVPVFLGVHNSRGASSLGCTSCVILVLTRAAVAQLAARRSHSPKVVSSILTCRMPPARAGPAPLVLAVQARRRGLSRIVTASRSPLAACQVGAGGPLQSPKQPGRTSSVDAWRRQWPVLPPCDRARVPQLARGGLQSGPACMAPPIPLPWPLANVALLLPGPRARSHRHRPGARESDGGADMHIKGGSSAAGSA